WEPVFGRALSNGVFGENLTTEGHDLNGALIGERWRIGADLVLEISCPRIPCATFQGWLDRKGWIKEFTTAAIPGPYLRVITPGQVRAGDPVEIVHRPDHDVTVALAFRAFTREPDLLPRLLVADALPAEDMAIVRKRTGGSGASRPRPAAKAENVGATTRQRHNRGSVQKSLPTTRGSPSSVR
ncbi:MAG TPA: MOSC domain-containing protein, partial [Phytomonospora sp.]